MSLDYLKIHQVIENFYQIEKRFPDNLASKNAFLAVCQVIDSNNDLSIINDECKYGGLIGPGNSKLHIFLKRFKLFRVHAAFHDAFGFMKNRYNLGPGYVYTLGDRSVFKNNCLLGHFTGLSLWIYLKLTFDEQYSKLPF